MFQQVFGDEEGFDEDTSLYPYRRYVQEYNPYQYLTQGYGRPGGPSEAETNLLNNSYYGSVAPLTLGGAHQAAQAQANFTNFLSPMAPGGGGGGGGGYGALTSDIFNAVGGQLPYPTAPQAPNFGALGMPQAPTIPGFQMPSAPNIPGFSVPSAPSLPAFQTPDVGGLAFNTYTRFADSQPGYRAALERALNPQIALPEQSIFELVAAQRGQGGPMDAYVNSASDALEAMADRRLQQQSTALQSRFAGEGSYLSGPMMNAIGELTASNNAEIGGIIGQLRLGAAEGESNRIYTGAQAQYENEAQRNALQAQIGAQTAQQMADVYGQIAASTGNAQAAAMADAYQSQASYLASTYGSRVGAMASGYGSQVGALANMYGSQAGAAASAYGAGVRGLTDIYGTQGSMYGNQLGALSDVYGTQGSMYNNALNASINQQQWATQQATQRAQDLTQMYGISFDQAMKMATAEQGNQQAALDALRQNYYQPGENLLKTMQPFFGLPSVTTPQGGGFGDFLQGTSEAFAQGLGQGAGV